METMELIARSSIYNQRHSSITARQIFELRRMHNCDERTWSYRFLQTQFKEKRLGEQYNKYDQRILISNYIMYLYVQLVFSAVIVLFNIIQCNTAWKDNNVDESCSNDPIVISELISHIVIFLTCLIILCYHLIQEKIRRRNHHKEKYKSEDEDDDQKMPAYVFKNQPWLLYAFSALSGGIIMAADIVSLIVMTVNDIRSIDSSNSTWSNSTMDRNLYLNQDYHNLIKVSGRVPVLSLYNILYIYFFYPISRKEIALIFGVLTSAIILTVTSICHKIALDQKGLPDELDPNQIVADVVYHIALNLVGWYARYMAEINNRRGFLDKRGCIETTAKLKFEKDKEANLINSIIPVFLTSQLRTDLRNFLENMSTSSHNSKQQPFQTRDFQKFENVSILYADICNFTPLTTTLEPYQLVETLNDLFGKFDDAAEVCKCLRIKILGDCYYSVSGAPDPDLRHAHHSVQLGLEMINLIKEVRREHNVNVNMRIGVHSGFILSGLLGTRKWQYDIWSEDVTIANHMESTGEAGAVHITSATKALVEDEYDCIPVVRDLKDDVIKESKLATFLIKPSKQSRNFRSISEEEDDMSGQHRGDKSPIDSDYESLYSGNTGNSFQSGNSGKEVAIKNESEEKVFVKSQRRVSIAPSALSERSNRRPSVMFRNRRSTSISSRSGSVWSDDMDRKRRKSILMDSSIKSYHKMMKCIEKDMENDIEELPIRVEDRWRIINRWKKRTEVENGHSDNHWKRRVSKDINPLFLVFRNMKWNIDYLKEQDHLFKHYILASYIILNCMGLILLITSFNTRPHIPLWMMYLSLFLFLSFLLPSTWISYIWDQIIDPVFELDRIVQPENKVIKFFYTVSGKLNTKSLYRNIIFIFISAMIVLSSITDVMFSPCIADSPRNYTYRGSLAIMTIFVFLRINNLLKSVITSLCLLFFLLVISGTIASEQITDFFSKETFGFDHWLNKGDGNWSHFIYIFLNTVFLLLSDRQKEYIHRLDYMWKRQLKKDQEEAQHLKMVNKILLQNILPIHVANIYTKGDRETGRLYSESHESAAVMFASIPNYIDHFSDMEIKGEEAVPLKVLNVIISTFDQLLFEPAYVNRIEKIKIIGSTLMVACGLQSNRSSFDSHNVPSSSGTNTLTLVEFAAEMMRCLRDLDCSKIGSTKQKHDFRLRVGICEGHVIAGVVGAMKPLYDIWGDTVNVASRMDYTGETGKIHLPESAALPLLQMGLDMRCRGAIDVKGKGKMVTYFVNLDNDFNLRYQIDSSVGDVEEEEDELEQEPEIDIRLLKTEHNEPGKEVAERTKYDGKVVEVQVLQPEETQQHENTGEIRDDQDDREETEYFDVTEDHIEHSLNYVQHTERENRAAGAGILKQRKKHKTKKRSRDVSGDGSKNIHVVTWDEQTQTRQFSKETVNEDDLPYVTVNGVDKESIDNDSESHLQEFTEEELERLSTKKDSGYGSQGVLKVSKNVRTDDPEVIKSTRVQPKKLSRDEILKHYDSYEHFDSAL